MDRLYSGWRLAFPPELGSDGLPHANLEPADGKTLFETIEQSGLDDEITYVVHRAPHTFAILNVYPYASGHLMVLPRRAVRTLAELAPEVHAELWDTVRDACEAAKAAFDADGLNVGFNEGSAGGASQPDHLHVHVVPRRNGDTNFMTSLAETRALPMTLSQSWQLLREHWPA
ncbi:MAG: HIT domain-containing protein [Actinomycetota bacterium]